MESLSHGSRDVESEEPEPKRMKLNELADSLSSSHQACQSEHNTLIQKWNDKTRISGKNSFASMETSTLSQIDKIMSNVSCVWWSGHGSKGRTGPRQAGDRS